MTATKASLLVPDGTSDNTLRGDTWLKQNVPLITQTREYKEGGALFIIWDEGEDTDPFSDGPDWLLLAFAVRKRVRSDGLYQFHSLRP